MLGGNFGVWGGLFSTFDCAVKGVRKKEDPWNAIIAGFFTGRALLLFELTLLFFFFCYGATPLTYLLLGGSLAVRGGAKAMRNNAIGCAILLAVIEGVGIGFQRMMAENMKLEAPVPPPQQQPALAE